MDAQEQVWFADGVLAIAVCKVVFESTDVVELSLSPGDRVLITRENVGEGWLEGECPVPPLSHRIAVMPHFKLTTHPVGRNEGWR